MNGARNDQADLVELQPAPVGFGFGFGFVDVADSTAGPLTAALSTVMRRTPFVEANPSSSHEHIRSHTNNSIARSHVKAEGDADSGRLFNRARARAHRPVARRPGVGIYAGYRFVLGPEYGHSQ